MWLILERSYQGGNARIGEMVTDLFVVTWYSILVIAAYAILACRNGMADANEHGARIEVNNRILLKWIFSVFLTFAVFAWVFAVWESVGVWSLAILLAVKAIVQMTFLVFERNRQHRKNVYRGADG